MKTTAFTTGLLALAGAAAAAPAADAQSSKPFTVLAIRSGSPIHQMAVNANDYKFWIGKPTKSYCPEPKKECPPGTRTGFNAFNGGLSMDAEVAGGQFVYIDPTTRALQYSIAHSSPPQGAILTGFTYTAAKGHGTLKHKGGFVACKDGADYQIFVPDANFSKTGCLGFDAVGLYPGTDKPLAWQYT